MKCSKIFNVFQRMTFDCDLEEELRKIKEPEENIKNLIERIRQGNKELKKQLPALMINGRFDNREDGNCLEYSNITALDYDKFETEEKLLQVKFELIFSPYVYAIYRSPSGNGLKVLIKHSNKNPEQHRYLYEELVEKFYYPEIDEKCKDLRRINYVSYDPDIYLNPSAIEYKFVEKVDETLDNPFNIHGNTEALVNDIGDLRVLKIFKSNWNKRNISLGNRNENLFRMAFECNKGGIRLELIEEELLNMYLPLGLSRSEISQTIRNAYKYKDKFGVNRAEINYRYSSKTDNIPLR